MSRGWCQGMGFGKNFGHVFESNIIKAKPISKERMAIDKTKSI